MKKLSLVVVIGSLFFTSCSNQESASDNTTEKPAELTEPAANAQQPVAIDSAAANMSAQPTVITTAPATAAPSGQLQQQAAPATVAEGMNPAHGQPGHRCDIPVGAPLNSPPGNTQQAAPAVNPAPVQR